MVYFYPLKPHHMKSNLQCPVDFVTINENQVRVTAILVFSFTLLWLWAGWVLIPLFLGVDFLLRYLKLGQYSLLNKTSEWLTALFQLGNKPVERAPKRFAALIGAIFSFSIVGTLWIGLPFLADILSVTLLFFAAMEGFLGICAGCYVYHWLQQLKGKKFGNAR